MANIRVIVSLNVASGIPEDRPVNVWHFTSDKNPATNTAIYGQLGAFYNGLNNRFSGAITQNDHTLKMYDLADPQPRAPFYENTFGMTSAPSGSTLPQEVALCLSFQGNRVSGQSQARRRGRIYVGPLNENQLDSAGRPVTALVSGIVAGGDDLLTNSLASSAWKWCVWSPTNQAMVQVTSGWVDNAFDIQRRRGVVPTFRTTFAS